MNRRNSVIGAIVGGAIGDAAGHHYEGCASDIPLPTDLQLSKLTDDTQLTLATCEAILETGFIDPERIAFKFLEWYRDRRFSGLGASTLGALRALDTGCHWALAGRQGEFGAGNGAAMRIAPLAFCASAYDRTKIKDVVRITHQNDEAYAGALAVIQAIIDWPESEHISLQLLARDLPDTQVRDRILSLDEKCDESIAGIGKLMGTSGFVVETIPLALFAASKVKEIEFEQVLRKLIQAGGDTDTTCSIAGQIAGSVIGFHAIPDNLISQIPDRDMVMKIATKFAEYVEKEK